MISIENNIHMYRLEFSEKQNAFHIQWPGENKASNGYEIIHCSPDRDILDQIITIVKEEASTPTVVEIRRTANFALQVDAEQKAKPASIEDNWWLCYSELYEDFKVQPPGEKEIIYGYSRLWTAPEEQLLNSMVAKIQEQNLVQLDEVVLTVTSIMTRHIIDTNELLQDAIGQRKLLVDIIKY